MMRITITVKPQSRHQGIERLKDGTWLISVHAPAREGKANDAIVKILAKHFSVPKSAIRIVMGTKMKKKIVEIEGIV